MWEWKYNYQALTITIMFDKLINNNKQHANITDDGIEKFIAALKVRHIKKKKNLLNEGDSGNCMFYVNEGLFRNYIFDEHGNEHTTDLIAQHNWFCLLYTSRCV